MPGQKGLLAHGASTVHRELCRVMPCCPPCDMVGEPVSPGTRLTGFKSGLCHLPAVCLGQNPLNLPEAQFASL